MLPRKSQISAYTSARRKVCQTGHEKPKPKQLLNPVQPGAALRFVNPFFARSTLPVCFCFRGAHLSSLQRREVCGSFRCLRCGGEIAFLSAFMTPRQCSRYSEILSDEKEALMSALSPQCATLLQSAWRQGLSRHDRQRRQLPVPSLRQGITPAQNQASAHQTLHAKDTRQG